MNTEFRPTMTLRHVLKHVPVLFPDCDLPDNVPMLAVEQWWEEVELTGSYLKIGGVQHNVGAPTGRGEWRLIGTSEVNK